MKTPPLTNHNNRGTPKCRFPERFERLERNFDVPVPVFRRDSPQGCGFLVPNEIESDGHLQVNSQHRLPLDCFLQANTPTQNAFLKTLIGLTMARMLFHAKLLIVAVACFAAIAPGSSRILQASAYGIAANEEKLKIGDNLPKFKLTDYRGTPFDSSQWQGSGRLTAIVFMGVECPLVKFYSQRLKEFQQRFDGKLDIVGINSNRQDSLIEIAAFAKQLEISFTILKDPGNRIADQFDAKRTPQVFLFDQQGVLCYRGAIDDQYSYGKQRPQPKSTFLLDAITASLAGDKVQVTQSNPDGCLIGRVRAAKDDSTVTYANQISRLLNQHCVRCHREGEIAPFALTEYEEVAGWADMIAEVTAERRMPPWHANPAHGTFSNDISLKPEQIKMIAQWVDDGAPLGDPKDLPEPPKFKEGWQIGVPDVVFTMAEKPQVVPATGEIPYQYFEVETNFKEDKWIQAAECRIGNRRVVHHIIVGLKGRNGKLHGQIDSEWITATAPGSPPLVLEDGYAKLIPAGSTLVFQMHYTPCGVEQTDLSRVGFKFADPDKVKRSVGTREIINKRFRIPPRENNFPVEANVTLDQDTLILSLFPHMHLRGKSFRYTAHRPNQEPKIILDIPAYDFNWQNGYKFEQPLFLPAGTRLHCLAHFDNSTDNFANPDPNRTVRWGDQTNDEMMIGYFDMAFANQDLTKKNNAPRTHSVSQQLQQGKKLLNNRIQRLASGSVTSDEKLNQLGLSLANRITNLDRICVTQKIYGHIKVVRVVQRPEFKATVGTTDVSIDEKESYLPRILAQSKSHVVNDLSKLESQDAKHMAKAFGSSFHVPFQLDGLPASVNFWSQEQNAFPPEIKQILEELAKSMTDQ